MFTLDVNGVQAQVVFSHREVQRLTLSGVETIDQTAAMIVGTDGQLVPGTTVGFAHRNPTEGNDEWEGRAFALARAAAALLHTDVETYFALRDAFVAAARAGVDAEGKRLAQLAQIADLLDLADELVEDCEYAQDQLLDAQAALSCKS